MYVWEKHSGRILAANEAVVTRYGWTQAELRGMSIEQLRPKGEIERLQTAIAALSRHGLNQPGVFVHQRRDGSTLQVEVSVHPMVYEGREAWLTMAVDVSERELARIEREGYIRQLEQAAGRTLDVVSTMVELRDPYTAGHERRVGELAAAIAAEMGLDAAFQQGLRMCGAVHDVGKIAVPAEILSKPMRLSKAEYQMVQQHAAQGYEILKSIELPWPLAEVARQHHERMDGSGYPRGLKGEEILLEARIIAIADVVESMASHRPYRPAIGPALALAEIEAGRGRLYDPEAADACLRLFREKGYSIPA
jgi:PAS domain S-box-containing protein